MATHSSILAWKIPGRGEPGRLQSMGSQRVGHDLATEHTHAHTHTHTLELGPTLIQNDFILTNYMYKDHASK